MMLRFRGSDAEVALPPLAATTAARVSLGQQLREVFRGAPTFSLSFLTLAILCAIFAPLLAPFSPVATNPTNILQAPSFSAHLLGTDNQGRDILSRLIYGAQTSVKVGILSVLLAASVGSCSHARPDAS